MIIRKVTVMVLVFNLATGFLIASGIPGAWDQQPATGIEDSVNDSTSAARNVSSERTSLSDSFSGGMIASVGKLTALDSTLFALPVLLANMGLPGWIVDFAVGPLYVVAAFDILSIIRGVVIE